MATIYDTKLLPALLFLIILSVLMDQNRCQKMLGSWGQGQVILLSPCPRTHTAPPASYTHTHTHTHILESRRPRFLSPSCLPCLDPDPSVTSTPKYTHTHIHMDSSTLWKIGHQTLKGRLTLESHHSATMRDREGQKTSKWGTRWKWANKVMRCNWEKWRRDRMGE